MNNSPIQTALCSFGMSGKVFHAPFVHANNGYNLCGVWERSKKTVKDFYNEAKSFDSLEGMLEDENIELVIINTPNATHFDYSKKALLAGKHIIVEKPFVIKSEEGAELIALAEQQQKRCRYIIIVAMTAMLKLLTKVLTEKLVGGDW
jgi:predicted dehydrogenase